MGKTMNTYNILPCINFNTYNNDQLIIIDSGHLIFECIWLLLVITQETLFITTNNHHNKFWFILYYNRKRVYVQHLCECDQNLW